VAAKRQRRRRYSHALADTEIVHVTCERGQAAMWLRQEDHWRIVDMYPLGAAAVTIAVDTPR
jgi:hypothetical protein